MDVREVLLAQLNACHNYNTWFVSLANAVEGLTAEQAKWKPDEKSNSIYGIVNHLLFYNQRSLNKFKDIPNEERGSKSTFQNTEGVAWEELIMRMNDVMFEWKEVVEAADDKKLNSLAELIAHLTIHTTYHTGQIIYIRKMQESWNAKDGVKG